MPEGAYYNTWLTVARDVLPNADGLCTGKCSKYFIPTLPSTKCARTHTGL